MRVITLVCSANSHSDFSIANDHRLADLTEFLCSVLQWVFLTEKAYQIRDTAIESSVMTKVKGFGIYNNKVMDVADYVTPTQVSSVFCIITKLITTENQVQGYCPDFTHATVWPHSRSGFSPLIACF
uniref:Uncharacterized protein n=1 Tax=Pundamilia nyererei TaxID=303518 RepID=A0A3B4FA62_9CICH